jgi:glycine/D-amino acid oxidase-like deaminating enzyme
MNRRSDPSPAATVDAVIVGGGIAGLWLHNLLPARGYATVLLEADRLGSGQTLASQGMIHGGLKYALAGNLTAASEAIAGMPARWSRCLAGDGELDLRPLRPLSDRYYLFAAATTLGRLTTFFASRALRGRIDRLDRPDYPPALAHAGFRGAVYALNDFVLDTPALLARLCAGVADTTYRCRVGPDDLSADGDGVRVQTAAGAIRARRLILTAGAGTRALLDGLGLTRPRMQLRPLHQVVVRHPLATPLYAHCLTGIRRPEPRLTITAHPDGAGWLWYLGGQIAGDGVAMTPAALAAHARDELRACLPWIDWTDADITTLRVDRAEPAQSDGRRPDEAFAEASGPCVVGWPTKLSLVPDLGDRVLALLPPPAGLTAPVLDLPPAIVGEAPWLTEAAEQG